MSKRNVSTIMRQMGWLPPSPDGIAMCQDSGVYSR